MTLRPSVLFVSHDATRTGAPIMLLHFLKWLAADGRVPFAVLVKEPGPLVPDFQAVGPTFVIDRDWPSVGQGRTVSLAMRLRYRLMLRHAARWARSLNVGLVYSNTAVTGDLCGLFSRINAPVLTHVHELDYALRCTSSDHAFEQLRAMSSGFIAASEAVAAYLCGPRGIPANMVTVHHEFIQLTGRPAGAGDVERLEARRELGVPEGAVVVLGVGTVHWRKGSDLFVQVAAAVRRSNPDVYFVWLGANPIGKVQFLHDVTRLGLENCVRCVESVPDPARYYRAADLFALTSREDPYPLVMLEAGAAGLPVVCFAGSGGGPEFVEDDSGVVVPYMDVALMADALLTLAADRAARKRLGDRAAEKVRQRHDVEVAAPKLAAEVLTWLGKS